MAVLPNLLASIPVRVLKSLLRREIRLLSPGFNDLIFLGLLPNTMIEVLIDRVGFSPLNIAWITSVNLFFRMGQHSW